MHILNIGLGYYTLKPHVCVCVCVCVCVHTLCHSGMSDSFDPRHWSPLGSSVHGILHKEYWNRLLFPMPGDLPNPRTEPSASPALAGRFFNTEPTGKPEIITYNFLNFQLFIVSKKKKKKAVFLTD